MSTTQNDVTNALTSAIQTIAESKVQSKEATLVIEAEIVEVIDEGLGTYKIKYLGNQFEATTAHTEMAYQIGDMVYVVVPNGDFDKNNLIFHIFPFRLKNFIFIFTLIFFAFFFFFFLFFKAKFRLFH